MQVQRQVYRCSQQPSPGAGNTPGPSPRRVQTRPGQRAALLVRGAQINHNGAEYEGASQTVSCGKGQAQTSV